MNKKTLRTIKNDIKVIQKDIAKTNCAIQRINTQIYHCLKEYKSINANLNFLEHQFTNTLQQIKSLLENLSRD